MNVNVLYQTEKVSDRACSFAKVLEIDGRRFKATHDTANCYSHTSIFVQTPIKTWEKIATEFDLGTESINYVIDAKRKRERMHSIYDTCMEYIQKTIF